jgi:L-seryl-tRNA(Ser) seleniumtransferase
MMTLRDLPSVDRVVQSLPDQLPAALSTDIARAAVGSARSAILAGEAADALAIAASAAGRLVRSRPTRVINATGVLLHTNLGRAPLHARAVAAAAEAAAGYGNLEIDLADGRRGGRGRYVTTLLTALTGGEAAHVVNNNAGALFLALAALGAGGSVPVSRGELIEIGGSYRLPELMAASGVALREVGTTNRTRAADYRAACDDTTRMLLKVHPSNYRVTGFTEEASLEQLRELATGSGVPLVFDAGSGLLDTRAPWLPGPPPPWLAGEPGVRQSLEAGADLVMFSGDKLLGGPQAGIIVGRRSVVDRVRTHPVSRAMRIDGPSLAALAVTLEEYARGTAGSLPFWAMATAAPASLRERIDVLIERSGLTAVVEDGVSTVGAGSVPGSEVPSPVMVVAGNADGLFLRLLSAQPAPVVARREDGRLVIDLRAVDPDDDADLATSLAACRS